MPATFLCHRQPGCDRHDVNETTVKETTTNRLVANLTLLSALCCGSALAENYRVPRLADGEPDLQGVWTNATATPLERAPELGTCRTFTEQETAAINKEALARVAADAAPSDPNAQIEAGRLPPVGNFNLFWTDVNIHEYACHEGNYALPGILAAEREAEKSGKPSTSAIAE